MSLESKCKYQADDGTHYTISGVPRPLGYMENPYIGKDGRDYPTIDSFREANKRYIQQAYPPKFKNSL